MTSPGHASPARLLRAALTLALMWVAVVGSMEAAAADQTGIRQDGRLVFFDPEGRVLARIAIETARTPEQWATGLMGRRSLAATEGMLFLGDQPRHLTFWMRNTVVPLDIVFVSADKRVVHIARNTTPLSDRRYRSRQPAQYVVEVVAGFCDRHGISIGTLIDWQLEIPDSPAG